MGIFRSLFPGTLSAKAIISVAIASCVVFPPFAYLNIQSNRSLITDAFVEKAITVSRLLDSHVREEKDFSQPRRLWDSLQKIIWLNPDVLWIDVNERDGDRMATTFSSRSERVGTIATPNNLMAMEADETIHEVVVGEDGRVLKVVSPIHVGKRQVGTFEMCMTLESIDAEIDEAILAAIITYMVLVLVFCLVLFLSLRLSVIQPIHALIAQVRRIAAGDLDTRATVSGGDELGTLADALNNMADAIRLRDSELAAHGKVLEEANRELEQTGEDLQAALVAAEEASQAKSEFLATMSHELRTPLNAIIGFSEIISGQYFGPVGESRYRNYAEDILNSSHHLLQLINDILSLSTIEAGKHSLDIQEFDFGTLLDECSRIVQPVVERKCLVYSADLLVGSSPIRADPRAIKQIVLNLLSNAVKFNDVGGRLTVRLKSVDGSYDLVVEDSGIGIDETELPNITDPFQQGNSHPHVSREGVGLGLSIVDSLVVMHGGHMNITSRRGEGTVVTVHLPEDATLEAAAPDIDGAA